MVGEHSVCSEGLRTTQAGAYRNEDVGISNDNAYEKYARRKSKVS